MTGPHSSPSGDDVPDHAFHRPVTVRRIGESGLIIDIKAEAAELPQIALFLGIEQVVSLAAEVRLTRWRQRGITLRGSLRAEIVQTCVVTLEPLPSKVEASFERRYLPEAGDEPAQSIGEVFVDPDAEDPPEPLGNEIDMGEAIIEELALCIDPYPRKPGVAFEEVAPAEAVKENPFAVLAKLKKPPKGQK